MSQEVTQDTTQYIKNKSFDTEFGVSQSEALGYDSTNDTLRPLAVDSSGQVKIDPTGLNSTYLKLTTIYSQNFSTSDWTLNGSYYELTVTHSLDSNDLQVSFWEGVELVFPEVIEQTDSNTLLIKVPSTPDKRFTGNMSVINVSSTTSQNQEIVFDDGSGLYDESGLPILI